MNEESRWEGAVLDSTIHAVSRGGDIEGLEGLSQGIGLDIKPYGLLGVNRDVGRVDRVQPKREAGADIFYRITPNLLSSTTINTDFAETEVDTRQVNLTRFSLFFPEKRAFFLEEAGVFQFGLPGAGNTMLPFFSRRIGLVGGETVPILFGEKLTGKIGRLEMGLLDVMTRDSDIAPGENFVVGRAKYGFWRQSYIGGIFTHGEPTGATDNSLGGADVAAGDLQLPGQAQELRRRSLRPSRPTRRGSAAATSPTAGRSGIRTTGGTSATVGRRSARTSIRSSATSGAGACGSTR